MPYTKAELLAALRADHPEFQAVDDERLFKALSADHPDIVKGMATPPSAEMSQAMTRVQGSIPPRALPPPPEEEKTPLQLGPFKTAVRLPKVASELLGAASTVTNVLPAGSTPRPNAVPTLTPEEQFGANVANTAMLAKGGVSLARGAVRGGIALKGAAEDAIKAFADRPREPVEALTQALKPLSTNIKFASDMERALPHLKAAEAATGQPIQGVEDLMQATKAAKKTIWSRYEQILGPQAERGVDASPVADAIVKSIPNKLRVQNPEGAKRIEALADTYRRSFKIGELDDMLTTTNAELASYYAKYPAARPAAALGNPDIAQNVAEAGALRDLIYSKLDSAGVARGLKKDYGALINVEKESQRRLNVAARQNPDSLSEQLSRWQAAARMAKSGVQLMTGSPFKAAASAAEAFAGRKVASALKEANSADSLVANAFRNFKGAAAVPFQVPPVPPKGLLGPGPIITAAPADTSFVRGVAAEPVRREIRGALPAYREPIVTPPPADTSYVRGVPTSFAQKAPNAKYGRPLGAAIGNIGKDQTIDNAVSMRLAEYRDLVRGGATERTGKAIREVNRGGDVSDVLGNIRGGGMKIAFPELANFPQAPGEIAASIERGNGPLYDRIVKAIRDSINIPARDEGLYFGPVDNPARGVGIPAARQAREKVFSR